MSRIAGGIDGVEAVFDDASLVADAGLLLAGTVMQRLGLEALLDATVRPSGAGRGSGRRVLSLVASMLVGGCCIDDARRLRSGSAAAVLPFAPLAPSTLGTFLRSFTFGHVRQLDKALESAQMRAWSVGAAPAVAEMTVDLDSTVCEVCGKAKHGAAYGHTGVLGYHPLVAVRSDTGEVLHSRMRSGSSQRGNEHFAREALARLRRLGADASVTVRADAGFFSYEMIAAVGAHGASHSITIPQSAKVKAAIAAIGDDDWASIEYTRGGEAQVAETTIDAGRRGDKLRGADGAPAKLRLIVRRTRLVGAQAELWPNWRYHCFVTDRADLDACAADAYHRAHATVELAITETSKRAPGSAAAPQDGSPPTAPGSPAACSRTTSRAGPPASAAPTPRASSPSRPPSATGSSPCQAASSTTAAATDCACRSTGHGQTPSPPPWNTSATCPSSSDPPLSARRSAAAPHAPPTTPAPHSSPARPKRAGPHTRTSPAATPAPNRRSHKPDGGFRLREREGEVPSRHSPPGGTSS